MFPSTYSKLGDAEAFGAQMARAIRAMIQREISGIFLTFSSPYLLVDLEI
jgi:hypothetical protein